MDAKKVRILAVFLMSAIIICTFLYHKDDINIEIKSGKNLISETKSEKIDMPDKKVEVIKEEIKEEPFDLSDHQRYIVECIVMGEAGGETIKSQMLVAQCILNGCIYEDTQPSKLRHKYKYAGFKTNVTESVKEAVRRVFDEGERVVDEKVMFFYATAECNSKWHESQTFIIECDGQRFFSLKENNSNE